MADGLESGSIPLAGMEQIFGAVKQWRRNPTGSVKNAMVVRAT